MSCPVVLLLHNLRQVLVSNSNIRSIESRPWGVWHEGHLGDGAVHLAGDAAGAGLHVAGLEEEAQLVLEVEGVPVAFVRRFLAHGLLWMRVEMLGPIQGDTSGRLKPLVDLDLGCSAILLGQ